MSIRTLVARHPILTVTFGYLLLRASDVLGLVLFGENTSPSITEILRSWDGGWYVRAASEGWPDHLDRLLANGENPEGTTWAWPPLYPLAGRLLAAPFGHSAVAAALLFVSLAAGMAAALVLSRLARPYVGVGGGVGVALLWASMPSAPALSMAYSEALFCAVAFSALLAASRERYVIAAAALLVAGLVRTSTAPFAVAIVVAAWLAWRGRLGSRLTTVPFVATVLLAGASVAAWPVVVAVRAGAWDGLSQVQAAWGRSTIPFRDTLAWAWKPALQGWPEVAMTVLVLCAGAVAAVSVWRDRRYPVVLRLVGPFSLAALVVTGVGVSGIRLLLPNVALPMWLQRLVRGTGAVVGASLVLLALRWLWIAIYVGGSTLSPPP